MPEGEGNKACLPDLSPMGVGIKAVATHHKEESIERGGPFGERPRFHQNFFLIPSALLRCLVAAAAGGSRLLRAARPLSQLLSSLALPPVTF